MQISINSFKKAVFISLMFSFCFSSYANVESEENDSTIENTAEENSFISAETIEQATEINQNLKSEEADLASKLEQIENKTTANERKIKALKTQIDLLNN